METGVTSVRCVTCGFTSPFPRRVEKHMRDAHPIGDAPAPRVHGAPAENATTSADNTAGDQVTRWLDGLEKSIRAKIAKLDRLKAGLLATLEKQGDAARGSRLVFDCATQAFAVAADLDYERVRLNAFERMRPTLFVMRCETDYYRARMDACYKSVQRTFAKKNARFDVNSILTVAEKAVALDHLAERMRLEQELAGHMRDFFDARETFTLKSRALTTQLHSFDFRFMMQLKK